MDKMKNEMRSEISYLNRSTKKKLVISLLSVMWMHRRVVLWDWELMHFQAYVYIIFVYRVVYVDMNTRSSQLNHLNLESHFSLFLIV